MNISREAIKKGMCGFKFDLKGLFFLHFFLEFNFILRNNFLLVIKFSFIFQ